MTEDQPAEETLRVRAQRTNWSDSIEFLLAMHDGRRTTAVGTTITMRTVERFEVLPGPTFTLLNAQAQYLMDELWRCGLRPSEGTGSAGALAAVERHLADMREIAMGHARNSIQVGASVALDTRPPLLGGGRNG